MILAPIVLFTYNRLWHTRQTIEALQRNTLAPESYLFVFSDGPRSEAEMGKVNSVREYIRAITGFKKVTIMERETNAGLARSIISGVTDIVDKFGSIIVLEDDMITSPFFLRYMNDALEFYKDEDRVISIHGYIYPLRASLPQTFFLRGADCWGWATWKRGWDLFEPDGQKLLKELKERKLQKRFDLNGAHPYTRMLKWQARGSLDSWAIRWHASAFLRDKLTLYPGVSLINNIGFDTSGTHSYLATDDFEVALAQKPIALKAIPLAENKDAVREFENYFRSVNSLLNLLRKILTRLFRHHRRGRDGAGGCRV
jgi:hypothetical protein